jgi:4'-phosphopantetheinyl transferase EntD
VLLPDGVRGGVRLVDATDELGLFAEERAVVERAILSRRREFATGRALLRCLTGVDAAIPTDADRRPVLPPGVVGSLTHDGRVVVAVTSTEPSFCGLGVDIEPHGVASDELATAIIRPDDHIHDATLALVIKEAAFKAWSRSGRPLLDHQQVRIAEVSGRDALAVVLPTSEPIVVRAGAVAGRWLAVAAQRCHVK